MENHQFQTPSVAPTRGWAAASAIAAPTVEPEAPITLQLTAGEARRIVRALEHTSLSVRSSPSGSRLAGNYIRLASAVRQQVNR